MSGVDTKDVILDAAERLFAAHGFDGTSLRQITTAARVNLAAVNYHFQSKEALIVAVLARRMRPISAERVAALNELEREAAGAPVELEKILVAFFAPVLRHPELARFKPLLARIYMDNEERTRQAFAGEVTPVLSRFGPAILRAVPGLTAPELHWRMHFMVGMMAHMLGAEPLIRIVSRGVVDPEDFGAMLPRLVAFAAAGLRANLAMENRTDATTIALAGAPGAAGAE